MNMENLNNFPPDKAPIAPAHLTPSAKANKHRVKDWDEAQQKNVSVSTLKLYVGRSSEWHFIQALEEALRQSCTAARGRIRAADKKSRLDAIAKWKLRADRLLLSLVKAAGTAAFVERLVAIEMLRDREPHHFVTPKTYRQQRTRLLVHLDRKERETTCGNVRVPCKTVSDAFNVIIDRLIQDARKAVPAAIKSTAPAISFLEELDHVEYDHCGFPIR